MMPINEVHRDLLSDEATNPRRLAWASQVFDIILDFDAHPETLRFEPTEQTPSPDFVALYELALIGEAIATNATALILNTMKAWGRELLDEFKQERASALAEIERKTTDFLQQFQEQMAQKQQAEEAATAQAVASHHARSAALREQKHRERQARKLNEANSAAPQAEVKPDLTALAAAPDASAYIDKRRKRRRKNGKEK